MFFDTDPRHNWTFHQSGMPRTMEADVEDPRPRPARPKFHSFDALRPGLFAPRPFQQQRERKASDGSGCYTSEEDGHSDVRSQSSTGSCGEELASKAGKERIIPITLEADEGEATLATPPPQRPPRKPKPDGAAETPTGENSPNELGAVNGSSDVNSELDGRDTRAQTLPPLNVNAAISAQQRCASQPPQQTTPTYGKPNYLNSSPKPFSPGAKPFQPAKFGMFAPRRISQPERSTTPESVPITIPVHRETSGQKDSFPPQQKEDGSARLPPKIAPKPKMSDVRPPPPPVKTARQVALEKIVAVHQEVNDLSELLDHFDGSRGDKDYLFLDEMLTRQLIRLDDVEANGEVDVRNSRKEAIKRIQDSLALLEQKCGEKTSVREANSSQVTSDASQKTPSEEGKNEPSSPHRHVAKAEMILSNEGVVRAQPALASSNSQSAVPSSDASATCIPESGEQVSNGVDGEHATNNAEHGCSAASENSNVQQR